MNFWLRPCFVHATNDASHYATPATKVYKKEGFDTEGAR